jgi:hypothetical protein
MQQNSLRSSLSARTYSIAAQAPCRYAVAGVRWSGGTVVALGDIVFFSEPFHREDECTLPVQRTRRRLCSAGLLALILRRVGGKNSIRLG